MAELEARVFRDIVEGDHVSLLARRMALLVEVVLMIASSLEVQAARSCTTTALEEWRKELLSPNSPTRFSLACMECGVFLEVTLHRLLTIPDAASGIVCSRVQRVYLSEKANLPTTSLSRLPAPAPQPVMRERLNEQEGLPFRPSNTVQPPRLPPHFVDAHDQGSLPDRLWLHSPERVPGRPVPRRWPSRPMPNFVPFNGTLLAHSRDTVLPAGVRPDTIREGTLRGMADPAMYV